MQVCNAPLCCKNLEVLGAAGSSSALHLDNIPVFVYLGSQVSFGEACVDLLFHSVTLL